MKKADSIFSLAIRERDKYRCQRCGKTKNAGYVIQCSHYMGRGNKCTRYDPKNSDSLCAGCHMYFEDRKQTEYRDWKVQQMGEDAVYALERKARGICPLYDVLEEFSTGDLKQWVQ